MNKVINFVRLDFITVKPYFTLKNLIIFLTVPLLFIFTSVSPTSAIGMFMALAVLYVSYPFAVGEKNGIDALYPTLSVKRGEVVLGRYLFAFFFDLIAGVIAFTYAFVALTILRKGFNGLEAFRVILILFVAFSIIQAIQLPIYFKLGYSKAKMFAYLPFIILPLIFLLLNHVLGKSYMNRISFFFEWIAKNPLLTAASGILVWFGLILISYKISREFYSRRDF